MSSTAAVPTQPEERLASLDVLRALALLGILVVNMFDFAYTNSLVMPHERWPAWWDQVAVGIMGIFFAGKFNSLFSFLFGIGFYLQLQRLAARGSSGTWIYVRRLIVLFVLGILHAVFLWWGDVLHIYAVLGLVLLLMRRASNWVLWVVMVLSLVAPTAWATYEFATMTPEKMEQRKAENEVRRIANNRALTEGSFWDATRERLKSLMHTYTSPRRALPFYSIMLTTVLLGFWVARVGYLQGTAQRRPFLIKALIGCLVFGLGCGVAMMIAIRYVVPYQISPIGVVMGVLYSLGRPPLMLAYAIAIVLALDAGWLPRFFHWLTFVGRMPLTNYLMQSVICTTLFYGYGFGLIDKVNPAAVLLLSFAIWGLQIPISVWWFRHFRFGPLEWMWRTVTYGGSPFAPKQHVTAPAELSQPAAVLSAEERVDR